MEINYIKEFITLAEIGSYLEAADALYLSQSTLSRHIQSIENDIGVQLFNRTTRKVELNEYGRLFLPYARRIRDLQSDYTQAITDQMQNINSRIRIGALPTMLQYHITDLLSRFQEDHPELHLDIIGADSTKLIKMLQNGKCDFAFIRTQDKNTDGLELLPYFTDHLVAVLSVSHPLAKASAVSLDQLKAESFLFLPEESTMYNFAMHACQSVGFTPHIAFTGHRAENIVDLASRGMGIGLLTKQPLLSLDTEYVSLVDIVPQFTTNICLAYTSESGLSPSARQFLRFFRNASGVTDNQ